MGPLDEGNDNADVLPSGSAIPMPTGLESFTWFESESGELEVIESRALPGTFGIKAPVYQVPPFADIEYATIGIAPDGIIENLYNSRFEFKIFRVTGPGSYEGPIELRGQQDGRGIIRDSFSSIELDYGERGLVLRDGQAIFELGNYDYYGQTGDNGFDGWGEPGQIGIFPYPVSVDYGDLDADYSYVIESGKTCCKG